VTRDELWEEFHRLLPTVSHEDFLDRLADLSFVFQSPGAVRFGYKPKDPWTNEALYDEMLSLAQSEAGSRP
jgi:hypothetical protein